jgi:signal transduction histidine kinase
VLAAAFLLGLTREWNPPAAVLLAHDLIAGMISPLLLHLAYQQCRAGPLACGPTPRSVHRPKGGDVFARRWNWSLAAFYALAATATIAANWNDTFETAPAWILCAAAAAGAVLLRRALHAWPLLAAMAVCAACSALFPSPIFALLPDYLLLAFFAVTLYYEERLTFFDALVKRGAFFAAGLLAASLFFPWREALLLMPFWLAAPWIWGWMERRIDRAWLHRRYTTAEAERRFVQDVQGAANLEDLIARAERSASEIFQTSARAAGRIELEPRPDGIPFLSDDRRLAESLSRTLALLRENIRFRELTSRAELRALRAQINPHFLFNALNAIAGLIQTHPELAEITVERLAEVFRYTLRKSDNEWVRLEEEMEFVEAYLGVEQARFGDRLRVEIDLADGAAAAQIPAMTVQPLVENAIKHGTSAVERPGEVRVRAAVVGGVLRVEVLDNGPGFREPAPEGHGLRNVSERLAGYYGAAGRLGWQNLPQGTRVWMELPCPKETARCGS